MISVEELLAPLPGDSPCGEDLSYDPALNDLDTRLQGKPETQYGDKIIAAEEPNWRDVQKLCLQLFGRTKDLRVTIDLGLTLLRVNNLPGFAQGMALLRGLLETYWPTLYPRLDPADNNDPLERMNLLASIAAPEGTFGDPLRIIARLRQVPLCRSAVAGSFSLAQITAATAPAVDGKPAPDAPNPAVIQAAFRDTPADFLAAQFEAAQKALADVEAIDEFLTSTVGAGNAANLDPLAVVLRDIRARLLAYAPSLPSTGVEPAAADAASATGMAAPGTQTAAAAPGTIHSREDVVRALDTICAYYAANEPSSPVPAMLIQAKNLVGLSFLEILQVLTPEATAQVKLTPPTPPAA